MGSCAELMLTNTGITFVDPTDDRLLGKHDWEYKGYRVVQPLVVDGTSVLLGSGMGAGTQRIEVRWDGEQFATETSWTSRRMSPYFNDYVAHNGYIYGFDNNIFACVDLATGQRKWKKGRYGNGQVLLLPSGNQLLVISEDGELVLLRASPRNLVELARHRVLKGRTWNHPVLVDNRLYVRNGAEAACFKVPISEADRSIAESHATDNRTGNQNGIN
jgi:outer membrane protein assembly factor BamB